MPRLRDSRGRFLKNIVGQPSSSSETSFKTKSSDNPTKPQPMENIGNPPHDNPPHENPPHNNPIFGNWPLQDYLYSPRISTSSCIMFRPNVQHQLFKPSMIQLLPTFHGLER